MPVFVEEGSSSYTPIREMPGIFRVPERSLNNEIETLASVGVKAIILFGVSQHKDSVGSDAWGKDGLVSRMVRTAKQSAPEMVVISDVCFCEYTLHGHCGVLNDGKVDNDLTLENLGRQAVAAAEAGADIIAPSGMMDGQVAAIRLALDANGYCETPIMSYSTKHASSLYGPFRHAAQSTVSGDRKSYQMDPFNRRESLFESVEDADQGADILLVKPALTCLDIISDIRRAVLLPLAAYQVSGEYSMIKFASAAGVINEDDVVRESLGAIKRAGADLIISYFTRDFISRGSAD
jgi:porphobilinogen synthase